MGGAVCERRMNTESKALLLIGLFVAAKLPGWPKLRFPNTYRQPDKGCRRAGGGATQTPTPGGAGLVWSEATMRLFVAEMGHVPITPEVVLLAIAVASNFNADSFLGSNTGLLMVRRQDLSDLNYPGVPRFEELDAPAQIPWIARVIALRMSETKTSVAPDNVGDLAVLLNPQNPAITDMLRAEANRRAKEAEGSMLYIAHHQLLRHVLANP
jgi:hypothetical protein